MRSRLLPPGCPIFGSPALSVQVEQDESRDPIEREGNSGPVPRLLPVRDRGGARSRQSEAPQGLALIPRAGAAPKVRKNPIFGRKWDNRSAAPRSVRP